MKSSRQTKSQTDRQTGRIADVHNQTGWKSARKHSGRNNVPKLSRYMFLRHFTIPDSVTWAWPVSGRGLPTSGDWWDRVTYPDDPEPNGSGSCAVVWNHDRMSDAHCPAYHRGPSQVKCVLLAADCSVCPHSPSSPETSFVFN